MPQIALVCSVILAGCAAQTVEDLGPGRHSLTATSQDGIAGSREEAVFEANNFCADRTKSAVIESFDDAGPQPPLGYTTSVTFTCL